MTKFCRTFAVVLPGFYGGICYTIVVVKNAERRKHMRTTKKTAMALGITAMAAMMSFTAPAAEKIEGITLELESSIYAGESGSEVEAILDDEGCYVDSVNVTNEPDIWEEDDKPKIKVIIYAEDGYTFASGFNKDDVALDEEEGTVTSVSRSSTKLTVSVTLPELYYGDDYDEGDYELDVYELAWDDSENGCAYWEGTDYAKKYELKLYRDGDSISSVLSTKDTTYDFSSYFTKSGEYSFKVRAVRNSNNTSGWSESDEWYVSKEDAARIKSNSKNNSTGQSNTGITQGAWLKDAVGYWWCNPDKSYPVSMWKQIDGAWYYFNERGYCVMNQWVNTNDIWYYCGETGAMLTNAMTPDNYYVGGDGAWIH